MFVSEKKLWNHLQNQNKMMNTNPLYILVNLAQALKRLFSSNFLAQLLQFLKELVVIYGLLEAHLVVEIVLFIYNVMADGSCLALKVVLDSQLTLKAEFIFSTSTAKFTTPTRMNRRSKCKVE
jgi:hypothetical protein